LSDSDLEDDEDERDPCTTESEAHPLAVRGGENTAVEEYKERRVEKGKVVKIPDIAFVTWVQSNDLFRLFADATTGSRLF
jgi:hypothetical protein